MIEAIQGNKVQQFAGPREAARALDLDFSAIAKCVSGKRKSHGGYSFRPADPFANLSAFIDRHCVQGGSVGDYEARWIKTADLLSRYRASQPEHAHAMTLDGLIAACRKSTFGTFTGPTVIRWWEWKQ